MATSTPTSACAASVAASSRRQERNACSREECPPGSGLLRMPGIVATTPRLRNQAGSLPCDRVPPCVDPLAPTLPQDLHLRQDPHMPDGSGGQSRLDFAGWHMGVGCHSVIDAPSAAGG